LDFNCIDQAVTCQLFFSVSVAEMMAHSEFDIDSNGVVSEEEAKVIHYEETSLYLIPKQS